MSIIYFSFVFCFKNRTFLTFSKWEKIINVSPFSKLVFLMGYRDMHAFYDILNQQDNNQEINFDRKYQAIISYQSTYKNIFKSIELVKISTETHLYDVVVVSKNNVRCDVLLMLLKTLNQLRFLSTTVYRLSITRALVFERDKLLYCKYF